MEPGEPLLDVRFLDELIAGIGADGAAEVMRAFLEEGPERMAAIQRAMAEGRSHTVRREAHALAGAARNVGLIRLGEAAHALQKATEMTDRPDAAVAAVAALLADTIPLAGAWVRAHDDLAA